MPKTTIEWCEFSVNPFRARNIETGNVGHFCVKCSPGCKNCYSSRMQKPFLTQLEFVAENRNKVDLFIEEKAFAEVLRRKKPTRYFWCDMTDMFLEDYLDDWIDRCFAVMALTPQHTHLVLTKRAERIRQYFADIPYRQEMIGIIAELQSGLDRHFDGPGTTPGYGVTWRLPLPNVWLGVSVEDQQRADERIPLLLQTPAAIRFLSIEPLLGPVDIRPYLGGRIPQELPIDKQAEMWGRQGIVWVIVGGESGPDARPMHPDWARSIRDQCAAAGMPFFFKQHGEYVSVSEVEGKGPHYQFPDGATVRRVGKHAAGATLDGREWREMPTGV